MFFGGGVYIKLAARLTGNLLLYILIGLLLVLLVLMPRETTSHRVGTADVMSYSFTWSSYKQNIVHYWTEVKENKTLGITMYEDPVEEELIYYAKKSIVIIIPAFFLSIFFGVWKGIYDYRHTSGIGKLTGKGSTWVIQSIPDFFFIMVFQMFMFFCMKNDIWKPDIYGDEEWYNIFLPIFYLCMYPAAIIARLTAEALEEEEKADYIRTARSKGAKDWAVIWKHALVNCWPKLLQHIMPIALIIMSAMFVVEYLSMYRGIGTRLIRALQFNGWFYAGEPMVMDTAAIIGFSLLLMAILLIFQWLQEILTFFLVPVRKEENK